MLRPLGVPTFYSAPFLRSLGRSALLPLLAPKVPTKLLKSLPRQPRSVQQAERTNGFTRDDNLPSSLILQDTRSAVSMSKGCRMTSTLESNVTFFSNVDFSQFANNK